MQASRLKLTENETSESEVELESVSPLNIELLRSQLNTQSFAIGDRLLYQKVVASTNALAMKLAYERPDEGMVVLTDSQTAGKGRQGRRWVDIPGWNVLSSTVLRPLFPPRLLVMLASLAVVDSIAETCAVPTTIKWPNDVLFEGRKIAGILIETSYNQAGPIVTVLGIGINVNGRLQELAAHFSTLGATATTLETACGHIVSRETLIAHLLRHIETSYLTLQQEYKHTSCASTEIPSNGPVSRLIRQRWRSRLSTLGRTIEVQQGNTILSGLAEDVNDNGELLLRCHSGERVSITWGDVSISGEVTDYLTV